MVLIVETGAVAERLRVRGIDDDEGQRLVRIVRRGTGSVVTWQRAQMVLLSAQGMHVAAIARVAFTSEDRVAAEAAEAATRAVRSAGGVLPASVSHVLVIASIATSCGRLVLHAAQMHPE